MSPLEPAGGTMGGARRGRCFSNAGSRVHAWICTSTRRTASAASSPSARADAYVNNINLDEIVPERFSDLGGKYAAARFEAGSPIGARRLGYQFVTLEAGARFCPMHSHALEEEMFLVWDGTPTIRTPRGSYVCRRGDVIAFPVGDVGLHQLCNESAAPCTVF